MAKVSTLKTQMKPRLIKFIVGISVILALFVAWCGWSMLSGNPYKDNDINITFPYYCQAPKGGVHSKKVIGIPYQVISCKNPQYTFETDGVIPADFYSLKIFNENGSSKLAPLGLSDEISKIKPELIIKNVLLPLENYQILNFKIIENKPINKNLLQGYYIKAKLNRAGKGEFLVEAIIYHHPSKKQFYILSTYYECDDTDAGVFGGIFGTFTERFFNSFRIF
jgi:hypothetical protein